MTSSQHPDHFSLTSQTALRPPSASPSTPHFPSVTFVPRNESAMRTLPLRPTLPVPVLKVPAPLMTVLPFKVFLNGGTPCDFWKMLRGLPLFQTPPELCKRRMIFHPYHKYLVHLGRFLAVLTWFWLTWGFPHPHVRRFPERNGRRGSVPLGRRSQRTGTPDLVWAGLV